jgi:hypothetical protein
VADRLPTLATITRAFGVLAWALAVGSVRAQAPVAGDSDPLATPACQAARAELDQARSDLRPPGPSRQQADRLDRARREAGRACLGESDADRRSRRSPVPPVHVAPVVRGTPADTPTQTAPPAMRGLAPSLPAPEQSSAAAPGSATPAPPNPVVTACDAQGCWDSNGRRLDRAGPLLLGPAGVCTLAGSQLNCR